MSKELSLSPREIEARLRREGILPGRLGLGEVAQVDPRLANAIIRPDLLGWGEPSCGWGWEILNLTGSFTAGAAGQNIEFQQQRGPTETDLWIRTVTYSVQRPNAFPGNIFKGQADYYNSLQPDINFTLVVSSYCKYVISPTMTPLQSISQQFECVCPVGFVIGCSGQLSGQFTNLREFTEGENPTIVTITLHAVRLPTRYDSCGVNEAVLRLQKMGILDEMGQEWQAAGYLNGAPEQGDGGKE